MCSFPLSPDIRFVNIFVDISPPFCEILQFGIGVGEAVETAVEQHFSHFYFAQCMHFASFVSESLKVRSP